MRFELPRRPRQRAFVACALLCVLIAAAHAWMVRHAEVPVRDTLERARGLRVYDRRGHLLRSFRENDEVHGRFLGLDEVSEDLVLATLVAEDKRFYEHDGVDERAIVRALGADLAAMRVVSGGSTITQQLVKLMDREEHGASPRGLIDKLVEAVRAEALETRESKRTILEAYLNRLPYGRGLVGPDAAARGYFGVAAGDLTLAQAAFLAVLPRAPSYLDPIRHPERARRRATLVLDALAESGLVAPDRIAQAREMVVSVEVPRLPFVAPHFADRIRARGVAHGDVTTTIDGELQLDVEALVASHVEALHELRVGNAAAIVVDNRTLEVLAYAGNADFFDTRAAGQVDVLASRRQPGSTLKPFVYLAAIADGRSPHELVADVPMLAPVDGYTPENFDGVFFGPMSAREALAASRNVPVVTLARELGVAQVLGGLERSGLASLSRVEDRVGLSVALGTGEVQLTELAAAYAMLARGGLAAPLRTLGADAIAVPERVWREGDVAAITDALSDPLVRLRTIGDKAPVDLGFSFAVKTGTSSGHRDAYCVGYTRERTVLVWTGNATGLPTRKAMGASAAGPLFVSILERAMRGVAPEPLVPAGALVKIEVCPFSGLPPGPHCGETVRRSFPHDRPPRDTCDVHRMAHVAMTASGATCDRHARQRVVALPPAFDRWLGRPVARVAPDGTPLVSRTLADACEGDAPAAAVSTARFASPRDGDELVASSTATHATVSFSVDGAGREEAAFVKASAAATVRVEIDGRVVGPAASSPRADLARGAHRARLLAGDGTVLDEVRFRVR